MSAARFTLADLPDHLRSQAEAQIGEITSFDDARQSVDRVHAASRLIPAQMVAVSPRGASDDRLGRMSAGVMNKTEARYAQHLEQMRLRGDILGWGFGRYSLRLASRTHYRPDFDVVQLDGRVDFDEVKGRWRDDARVKIKIAAEQYPGHRFRAIRAQRKRDGGGWSIEDFG